MTDVDVRGIGMTSERTRRRLAARLEKAGISNVEVLETIVAVPRHIFVDEALAHRAYEDTALPIGYNQTISQPYVVALMTQALLSARPGGERPRRVLEIGTGSGYQTAVLAALFDKVFTVERIAPLAERARARLEVLGCRNVRQKHDDGKVGWVADAPFDAILVTAGAREIPEALMEQLVDGGRLVIPVGDSDVQELKVVDRDGDGWRTETLDYVRFVPLVSGLTR